MIKITIPELIRGAANKTELNQTDTEIAFYSIIETIVEAVASGDKVKIQGFGSFEPKLRAARKSRNPRTKEDIMVPAKRVPVFKAGKEFKEAVNG